MPYTIANEIREVVVDTNPNNSLRPNTGGKKNFIHSALAGLITGVARLATGVQVRWIGCRPDAVQRIYIANHTSHVDFALVWASLPPELRANTRPIAAADYWEKGPLRRFVVHNVIHGVLIDRNRETRTEDPIDKIVSALDGGYSLIAFPEGTRNTTDELLIPFKSGIYYVAKRRPDVEVVPVWIENVNRVMPKGAFIPIPLLCSVTFGDPLRLVPNEEKDTFISRASHALLDLAARVHRV